MNPINQVSSFSTAAQALPQDESTPTVKSNKQSTVQSFDSRRIRQVELPNEVWMNVLSHLARNELLAMRSVDTTFKTLTEESLRKYHVEKKFRCYTCQLVTECRRRADAGDIKGAQLLVYMSGVPIYGKNEHNEVILRPLPIHENGFGRIVFWTKRPPYEPLVYETNSGSAPTNWS